MSFAITYKKCIIFLFSWYFCNHSFHPIYGEYEYAQIILYKIYTLIQSRNLKFILNWLHFRYICIKNNLVSLLKIFIHFRRVLPFVFVYTFYVFVHTKFMNIIWKHQVRISSLKYHDSYISFAFASHPSFIFE